MEIVLAKRLMSSRSTDAGCCFTSCACTHGDQLVVFSQGSLRHLFGHGNRYGQALDELQVHRCWVVLHLLRMHSR